ncbi:PREDICTED: uncharacterized protein LOC105363733 [Ceratosolen solmsi marchali]|uniref:Uncharacterized protein LOC105363733 n=1 Tax=Ceratosolen solmsi marchali TaxID=326594 RepID=A0AAJ6YKL5_9HYME|nr:PREDICTED: uncharacterized protein LOC105363733 [Ceratosolen solmsi marchali]
MAEPPLQAQQRSQGQRYFFARQEQQTSTAAPAPYPASGWKPDGPAFNLPQPQQRQHQTSTAYGLPRGEPEASGNQYVPPQAKSSLLPQRQQAQSFASQRLNGFERQTQARAPRPQEHYNAPQAQYGAPEYSTTEFPDSTEFDEATTVVGLPDSEPESLDSGNEFDDIEANGQARWAQQPQERGQYFVALPDGRLQRVRYVSRQDLEAMRYFAKIRAENVEPLRGPIYAYAPLQKLEVTPGSLQSVPVSGLSVTAVDAKPQKLVAPKVDIKPLAQLQYQHDNQARPTSPTNAGYATYTSDYQVPTNFEERYILAFP